MAESPEEGNHRFFSFRYKKRDTARSPTALFSAHHHHQQQQQQQQAITNHASSDSTSTSTTASSPAARRKSLPKLRVNASAGSSSLGSSSGTPTTPKGIFAFFGSKQPTAPASATSASPPKPVPTAKLGVPSSMGVRKSVSLNFLSSFNDDDGGSTDEDEDDDDDDLDEEQKEHLRQAAANAAAAASSSTSRKANPTLSLGLSKSSAKDAAAEKKRQKKIVKSARTVDDVASALGTAPASAGAWGDGEYETVRLKPGQENNGKVRSFSTSSKSTDDSGTSGTRRSRQPQQRSAWGLFSRFREVVFVRSGTGSASGPPPSLPPGLVLTSPSGALLDENDDPLSPVLEQGMNDTTKRRHRRGISIKILVGVIELHPTFVSKYLLEEELGLGGNGFVFSAYRRADDVRVAVKLISKQNQGVTLVYDEVLGLDIPQEIYILKRCIHKNIVHFLEFFVDDRFFYLVTELFGNQWLGETLGSNLRRGSQGRPIENLAQQVQWRELRKRHSAVIALSNQRLQMQRTKQSTPKTKSFNFFLPTRRGPSRSQKHRQQRANSMVIDHEAVASLLESVNTESLRRFSMPTPSSGIFHGSQNTHSTGVSLKKSSSMDLFECIDVHGRLPEHIVKIIFRQLAQAVNYLHSSLIVHGDIKDENVLIDENYNIKLIDFGASRVVREDQLCIGYGGTMVYASPEIFDNRPYDPYMSEIWSVGMLLYTMSCGCLPFRSVEEMLDRPDIIQLPQHLSASLMDLILECLEVRVERRATIRAVLQHPWLTREM